MLPEVIAARRKMDPLPSSLSNCCLIIMIFMLLRLLWFACLGNDCRGRRSLAHRSWVLHSDRVLDFAYSDSDWSGPGRTVLTAAMRLVKPVLTERSCRRQQICGELIQNSLDEGRSFQSAIPDLAGLAAFARLPAVASDVKGNSPSRA
jgi:hypothetical protein